MAGAKGGIGRLWLRRPHHSVHVPPVQISSAEPPVSLLPPSTPYVHFHFANVCESCSIAHRLVIHFRFHRRTDGPYGEVEVRI